MRILGGSYCHYGDHIDPKYIKKMLSANVNMDVKLIYSGVKIAIIVQNPGLSDLQLLPPWD